MAAVDIIPGQRPDTDIRHQRSRTPIQLGPAMLGENRLPHRTPTLSSRAATRAATSALPNLAITDQGGACGAAGPASAPRALPWEARPGARRATPTGTLIKVALTARRPVRRTAVFLAHNCPAPGRRV